MKNRDSEEKSRKNLIPHKIESATKLSKDIELIDSEVTGRIPVASSALKCGLDTHFISQQPLCRKVRRLSSTNERRSPSEPRKRKFKNRQTSGSLTFCSR